MRLFRIAAAAGAALALLSGCGEKDLSPKDPVWDRQVCGRCGMTVSDRKFAAQAVVAATGERLYFDDIGCAISWVKAEAGRDDPGKVALYAAAADSGKWLDARKSAFAGGFVTPMSSGFGAFASAADVPPGRKAMSWDEAVAAHGARAGGRGHGHH